MPSNKKAPFNVEIQNSKEIIGEKNGGLHTMIKVTPQARKKKRRNPVALAIVIDRSGSMSELATNSSEMVDQQRWNGNHLYDQDWIGGGVAHGMQIYPRPLLPWNGWNGWNGYGFRDPRSKLEFVKRATKRLLDLMSDGDAISIVTFDSFVQVIQPFTILDNYNRTLIQNLIDALQVGGNTYLEGGLKTGVGQLENFGGRENFSNKVLLLSDGEANQGISDIGILSDYIAGVSLKGITLSTLGVGISYNSKLMASLADAGKGDFHHVEIPENLDSIFIEEMKSSAEVVAKNVEIELVVPAKIAVSDNLNGYPCRDRKSNGNPLVQIGDLVRAKDVLFELTTPIKVVDRNVLVKIIVHYVSLQGKPDSFEVASLIKVGTNTVAKKAKENRRVIERVIQLLQSGATINAMQTYESGDFVGASAVMDANIQKLSSAASYYSAPVLAASGYGETVRQMSGLATQVLGKKIDDTQTKKLHSKYRNVSRSKS